MKRNKQVVPSESQPNDPPPSREEIIIRLLKSLPVIIVLLIVLGNSEVQEGIHAVVVAVKEIMGIVDDSPKPPPEPKNPRSTPRRNRPTRDDKQDTLMADNLIAPLQEVIKRSKRKIVKINNDQWAASIKNVGGDQLGLKTQLQPSSAHIQQQLHQIIQVVNLAAGNQVIIIDRVGLDQFSKDMAIDIIESIERVAVAQVKLQLSRDADNCPTDLSSCPACQFTRKLETYFRIMNSNLDLMLNRNENTAGEEPHVNEMTGSQPAQQAANKNGSLDQDPS